MPTIKALRTLWQRRLLVGLVLGVALIAGLAFAFEPSLPPESRQYDVGLASGRILVDTPNSQVVDIAPKGSEMLGARASVLAALMTDGAGKDAIARRAGLEPDQIVGVSDAVAASGAAAAAPADDPSSHRLTTRVVRNADGFLPIIEFDAQAPSPAAAGALAAAAVAGLRDHLDSKAARDKIADGRRLRVSELGIEPGRLVRRGPRRAFAAAVSLFVLLGGCALIAFGPALTRAWREAGSAAEPGAGGESDDVEVDETVSDVSDARGVARPAA